MHLRTRLIKVLPVALFATLCCTPSQQAIAGPHVPAPVVQPVPAKTALAAFNRFRSAVTKGDQAAVKSFFSFPITDSTNQLWNMLNPTWNPDDTKNPFTEPDFDKNYSKIFTKEFKATIAKVNAETLFQKGGTKSTGIIEKRTTYTMIAKVDNTTHTLRLDLHAIEKPEQKGTDYVELSNIYVFNISEDGQLTFARLEIA